MEVDPNVGRSKPGAEQKGDTHSFRQRFTAWWEGYSLTDSGRDKRQGQPEQSGADVKTAPTGTFDRFGRPLWTATRIEVAEKMWGHDFVSPGGEDYLKSLVKPLGLNREMSVLDLSAGLGGPARCIHTASGAWVTGLEANPLLAEHGEARSVKLGLKKQAGVSHYDPSTLAIERRFDAVFSKELFFSVQDKRKLFRDIHDRLKPFGQFLFLDYVLEDGKSAPQRWLDREPLEPFPVTAGETKRLLTKERFDVRITEDCTSVQLEQIGVGLAILERHLVSHSLDPETTRAVKEEVELWVGRAEALRHGLKVYRYYALAME